MDIYQRRYLAYQKRKKKILAGKGSIGDIIIGKSMFGAIGSRASQRIFNDKEIALRDLNMIYQSIQLAPSSCNRQAILVKVIESAFDKTSLERLLVGGKNWLSGAKIILLLFADMAAYKSPVEVNFMPYLDAGVVVENIYLAATTLFIGACYVNPNIPSEYRPWFDRQFNPRGLKFCGAMALGKYDTRMVRTPKRRINEIFY